MGKQQAYKLLYYAMLIGALCTVSVMHSNLSSIPIVVTGFFIVIILTLAAIYFQVKSRSHDNNIEQ